MNDQITAIGQLGKLITNSEWVSKLIIAFGWMGLLRTTSGQKEYDAIGQ